MHYKNIKTMKVLVFDVETTGLPTKWNPPVNESNWWPYIVQISWMIYNIDENKVEQITDKIIKLENGMEIPEESTKIHGITNEIMNEKGVHIKNVLGDFINDLKTTDVAIAHNLKFDKSMVLVESNRNNLDINFDKREFCTMLYGEKLCGLTRVNKYGRMVSKYPKLIELHNKLFCYEPTNLHNSLYDVAVCLRCYVKMRFNKDLLDTNEKMKSLTCF